MIELVTVGGMTVLINVNSISVVVENYEGCTIHISSRIGSSYSLEIRDMIEAVRDKITHALLSRN